MVKRKVPDMLSKNYNISGTTTPIMGFDLLRFINH